MSAAVSWPAPAQPLSGGRCREIERHPDKAVAIIARRADFSRQLLCGGTSDAHAILHGRRRGLNALGLRIGFADHTGGGTPARATAVYSGISRGESDSASGRKSLDATTAFHVDAASAPGIHADYRTLATDPQVQVQSTVVNRKC